MREPAFVKTPGWIQRGMLCFVLFIAVRIEHGSGAELDSGFDAGARADADILGLSVQDDGKIIAVGEFTTLGGTNHGRVARLHPDGSIDPSFATGTGASGTIRAVAIQSDGKIVVGGDFWTFNGLNHHYLARLNPDGSVDTNFNASTDAQGFGGIEGTVRSLAIQPDGRIVIGGTFINVGGTGKARIARLHPDGSLDTSFNPGTGVNDYPRSIVVRPDGRILVAGRFTSFNNTWAGRIVRLLSDGSIDPSFDPGQGADATIRALALDSNGRIYIGGDFEVFNGTNRSGVARLHLDGGLDLSFDQGNPADDTINTLAVGPEGKVWIGGLFQEAGGLPRALLARLNENGTADPAINVTFDNRTGDEMYALKFQSDGLLLVAGEFRSVNNVVRHRLARLVTPEAPTLIRLGPASFTSGLEGSNATFTVERIGPTNLNSSVAFSTESGSAVSGADFVATNGTLFFAPGEVRKTIPVSLRTDLVFDPDEEFRLNLSNPQGAVMGVPFLGTARITENSPKIEVVTIYNYQFYEGTSIDQTNAHFAFFELKRSGYVFGQVWSVDYEIIPGSATHGQDFTGPLSGTVDFTVGNDFRSVLIPLVNDGRGEPAETLTVRLTSAVGAVLTPDNQFTLTILDDDGPIEWAASEWRVSETRGTAEVMIRRNDNGPEPVSVSYSITAGSAAGGVDFVPAQGTVTFAPLERSKSILVTLFDDCRIEPDESVNLVLQNANGGTELGTNSISHLLIQDNERPGSFDITFGANGFSTLRSGPIALHTDGALLVGSTELAEPGGRVIRVLPNGNLDPNFFGTNFMPHIPGWPVGGFSQHGIVVNVRALPNGRILVRGLTEGFGPDAYDQTNHLFRLEADGQLDDTFSLDSRVVISKFPAFKSRFPSSLEPLHNGILLAAAGAVSASGEIIASDLLRLHPDGALDLRFRASLGPDSLNGSRVHALASLPDGRILVSGWFEFAGTNFPGVVRLLSDGAIDPSFAPSLCVRVDSFGSAYGYPPVTIVSQSDGRILLGGAFSRVNNSVRRGLARLQPDGQLDGTFDPVASLPGGFNADITAMTLDEQERILVGGALARIFTEWPRPVARLLPDGRRDVTFEMNTPTTLYDPTQILVGRDDKAVVATYSGIFRLNGDAMPEITFTPGPGGTKWRLSTAAITGDTYRLQSTQDFASWATLQTQRATGCSVEFLAEPDLPPQFYRIKRLPAP